MLTRNNKLFEQKQTTNMYISALNCEPQKMCFCALETSVVNLDYFMAKQNSFDERMNVMLRR